MMHLEIDPTLYVGVEVCGVVTRDGHCEANTDDAPEFFSVYLRGRDHLAQCIADFDTHTEAMINAQLIAGRHGWPLTDYASELHGEFHD